MVCMDFTENNTEMISVLIVLYTEMIISFRETGDSSGSLERLVECVRLGVEAGGGGVRVTAVLELLQIHVLPRATHHSPALARAAHRLLARYHNLNDHRFSNCRF